MTTKARALGALFDIAPVIAPADLCGGASTGKAVSLRNAEGCTFVVFCAAGTGVTDDLAVDVQQIADATGVGKDLDIVTTYYTKSAATLSGDEVWVETTQTPATSEIAAIAGTQELDIILVVEVRADQMDDGYSSVSLNIPDLGAADAKYGGVVAILWGLDYQRAPDHLPAPQE